MRLFGCDGCGEACQQVHIIMAEDEMGIIGTATLCDDCCDAIDFEYEYLISLKDKEETDKFGLFN